MRFEREIDIRSPKEKVWRFLWDVDRFIACVPGCKEAGTVEPGKRYTATMEEKVGPFRVEFPMNIDVQESRELSYIKAVASGSDSKIGSRMKVELEVNLAGEGDQTKLLLAANVDILGKLATLGHSMIKRKADQVMDQFAGNLKQKLEANA
ncbi:MAG TPA: SRPBCC domain-containing protein [Candidatus Binatia bacterium]